MPSPRVASAFALLAVVLSTSTAFAQGVGINATGAAADTSAILDLSATNKGLLVPRMTAAQRAAIVLPATGLVVYQTDGTAGLYYNAGTSGAPNWQMVGAGATSGQWSASGANLYYSSGKVAVGTTPGAYRFTVQDTGSVLRVAAGNANGVMASFGGAGQIQVDAPGVFGGRLALLDNGNLGLGVASPTNKLSFAAALGKKISLYPGTTGDVGFGVSANRLQIYSDNPNADVALGYDAAGTFNERFAFKPNGAMAVNGSTGTAGQVLQSNGSGAAATWVNPGAAAFSNTSETSSLTKTVLTVPFTGPLPVPGMSKSVTVATTSKALVNWTLFVASTSCFGCGSCNYSFNIVLDGAVVRRVIGSTPNGDSRSESGACLLTLAPGAHTIEIQLFTLYGTGATIGWDFAPIGNDLIVQVIPQ